jgi:2-amino-4-hydroxy-6-hydroxymethyldihydropteridine diphosphokinase
MAVTFLSLGSNLGVRELYLKKGIEGLNRRGVDVLGEASVYETEPKDVGDQPWFLNTVVEARTRLSPRELLTVCMEVERENARDRTAPAKSARTLDIDILFYDQRIVREMDLTIPHPRLAARKFVLVPLGEIAPGFIDPVSGDTVSALLERCLDTAEVRLHQ